MVQVKDLPEEPCNFVNLREFLYCPVCSAEYSAQRGDYWAAEPTTPMTCECGIHLALVKSHTELEIVKD